MAVRYYDDAITYKLKSWIPDNSRLRVLAPNESKRLIELRALDSGDKPFDLPVVALSRKPEIELLTNIKHSKSYNGLQITSKPGTNGSLASGSTALMNVIPIRVEYQLDIYTKTQDECEEYVRNFLFKMINNPLIVIEIPYNDVDIHHTANIRVLPNVADTSDITEHLFPGQFTRWTIQFELQDGFLFSIPYKQNWSFMSPGLELVNKLSDPINSGILEEVSQLDETFDPLSDGNDLILDTVSKEK